jgi:hypothetical protein
MHAWRCFCLGLFEYRRGNYAESVSWLEQALAAPNLNDAREAAIRLVTALAYVQLGKKELVDADVARADLLLRTHAEDVSKPSPRQDPAEVFHGYWFDWVINQVLREELGQARRVRNGL